MRPAFIGKLSGLAMSHFHVFDYIPVKVCLVMFYFNKIKTRLCLHIHMPVEGCGYTESISHAC